MDNEAAGDGVVFQQKEGDKVDQAEEGNGDEDGSYSPVLLSDGEAEKEAGEGKGATGDKDEKHERDDEGAYSPELLHGVGVQGEEIVDPEADRLELVCFLPSFSLLCSNDCFLM